MPMEAAAEAEAEVDGMALSRLKKAMAGLEDGFTLI